MNEKQLQEIEFTQDKLPNGEKWEVRGNKLVSIVDGKSVLIIDIDASPKEFEIGASDIAFMACAREKMPALISEVRRLRAVVEVYADRRNWAERLGAPLFDVWIADWNGYTRAEECLREAANE